MLTWKFHTGPIHDLAFTPDGRLLTCSSDWIIRLWDVATRTELRRWECENGTDTIAVSPDGRWFARWGPCEEVVWRADDKCRPAVRGGGSRGMAFSPTGRAVITIGGYGVICRWAIPSGKLLTSWDGHALRDVAVGRLALSTNGETLAVGEVVFERGRDGISQVSLLDIKNGDETGRLTPSVSSKYGGPLTFSPDGRLLASLHAEAVVVWDVVTRTEVVRRAPNKNEILGLAFTADGQRLLTAGHDELVRVWAAPKWDEVTSFDWKIGRIKCLTVNRDGTLAAAGGDRGKVVVWDLD